jgi:hypothetical protein
MAMNLRPALCLVATVAAVALANPMTYAKPIEVDPADKPILDAMLQHARNEVKAMTPEHVASIKTPETFCWVDLPELAESLTAYEFTENADHLRDFVTGFEVLKAAMEKGDDGLLSWYGKPIDLLVDPAKPDAKICEIQTDFRATTVLSRFVEIVRRDPNLAKEFGAKADEYLSLAEDHLVKKWHTRGYYVDLGEGGAVYRWNKDYTPKKAFITLAHEKQSNMIEALLTLHRASGKQEYLQTATKLGVYLKKSMREKDGHYLWNYWDATGDWDQDADGKPKHWVNVEPKGMWFDATVSSAVLLHRHGVVFQAEDIQKLVKTQMEVCWNGDAADPKFSNTAGTPVEKERFISPSLAAWDAKLADFVYGEPAQKFRLSKKDDHWQGGVIAATWLRGKYIDLPAAKAGQVLKPVTAK